MAKQKITFPNIRTTTFKTTFNTYLEKRLSCPSEISIKKWVCFVYKLFAGMISPILMWPQKLLIVVFIFCQFLVHAILFYWKEWFQAKVATLTSIPLSVNAFLLSVKQYIQTCMRRPHLGSLKSGRLGQVVVL